MKVVVCSVISSSYLAACSPPLPGHKEYPMPSPHPCAVQVTSTETEKSADVTEHIALMVSPIVGVCQCMVLWKYLIFANSNTNRRYHSKDKKKLLHRKQSKQSDNTLASSDDEQHFG
ncbi:unnamed protein product [Rhizophagus irregularis]|nr:unnamed protein product [Rhizophagus irregularis]